MEKYSVTMVIISAVALAGLFSGVGLLTESVSALFMTQILLTFFHKFGISVFVHYSSIPNKARRIALFGAWYLAGLAVTTLLSFLWPTLNPVWFVAQQVFLYQGINGIIWRGSLKETVGLLPGSAYVWILLGTLLLSFSSNFILHQTRSTNLAPLGMWLVNSIPYFFPLLLQGGLIIYLAIKSQPPNRMRRGTI